MLFNNIAYIFLGFKIIVLFGTITRGAWCGLKLPNLTLVWHTLDIVMCGFGVG